MGKQVKTDVAIIGGGISGLTAGHFLKKQGRDVCILEKNKTVGGAVHSEQREGFLIEYGPTSILDTTPLLHEIFSGLNIEDELIYANDISKNRYIVRNGMLNALPMSPQAFLRTRLFSASAKFRLLKEPFVSRSDPSQDESLADFVTRRLGREFLDYAINPFVAGVYAGKPEALSVQSAFPKLYQLEQDYGSLIKGAVLGARKRRKSAETSKSTARLCTFRNGLQTLINALCRDIENRIFTDINIQEIRKSHNGFEMDVNDNGQIIQVIAKSLLLTVPTYAYPTLPLEIPGDLIEAFQQVYYPPVTMVYLGFSSPPSGVALDGFGFLIPEKEKRRILGTIWSSTIFPNRAPNGGVALTTFVGGSRQPENALLPEEDIVALVRNDIQGLMGIHDEPDLVVVKKWEKAIPQYRPGHQKIIEQIEIFERAHPGLFISGNFRGGISVADCVKQSHTISTSVHAYLNGL